MKRLLLPLVLASPIFAALAPHADAAAITLDSRVLRPRLLGPASFQPGNRASVPGSVFKQPTAPRVSNAVNNSLLTGSTLQVSGGVVKTGAGTITLSGTAPSSGGSLLIRGTGLSVRDTGFLSGSLSATWATLDPGAASLWAGGVSSGMLRVIGEGDRTFVGGFHSSVTITNGGAIDTNGFDTRITPADILSGGTIRFGSTGAVLTKTGSGTLTFEPGGTSITNGSVIVNVASGTFGFQGSQTLDALTIDAGEAITLSLLPSPPLPPGTGSVTIAPAPAQVPEPGTAVLFAIGMIVLRQASRRRAV